MDWERIGLYGGGLITAVGVILLALATVHGIALGVAGVSLLYNAELVLFIGMAVSMAGIGVLGSAVEVSSAPV